jgi:fucose permease
MIRLFNVKTHPQRKAVILAFAAFIALGMPDGLLGIAWPSIRQSFSVPLDAAGFLLAAGVAGYVTSSFLSGPVIARIGVGTVLVISCFITGAVLIGYTLVPSWWMMVMIGIAGGAGAGAIDAGLNTYAAARFGERLMQWLHASYGIGISAGPFIMTLALVNLNSWKFGYHVSGIFQLLLSGCFLITLSAWDPPSILQEKQKTKPLTDYKTSLGNTLRNSGAWISMLLFFLYTGSEVSLGTWGYTLLTESRGISTETAGFWAGSYWVFFTIGRFLAGLYAEKAGINMLVICSLAAALTGSLFLWWNPFSLSNLISVALIGLAIAPIFPALMSGTSQRVGIDFAANTIGMQMAAGALGTAIIPSAAGILARQISLEVIPLFLVILFMLQLIIYSMTMKGRLKSDIFKKNKYIL